MADVIQNVKIKFVSDTSDLTATQKALKGVSDQEKEVADDFKKVNNEAKKAHDTAAEGAAKTTNASKLLGNELKTAAGNINIFGVNAGQAFSTLETGIGGAVRGLNVFKLALVSIGIGAFLVTIGSLVAYFKRTEEGAEKLERGLAGLGAAFGVIIGKIASFGKTISDAFTNPKQAVINFGNSIKEFLIDRINVFIGGIKGLGESISLLFKGEFTESAKAAGKAFLDINRGINPLVISQELLIKGYLALGDGALDAAEKAMAFTQVLQDIEDDENNLSVAIAKQRNEIQKLIIESKNRGLTAQQSTAKLLEADRLEQDIINKQIALQERKVAALAQENKLKLATKEIDAGNKTDALRQAEIELENLRGNSFELRARLQNRIDGNEIRAAKEKNKSITQDVEINLNEQIASTESASTEISQIRTQEETEFERSLEQGLKNFEENEKKKVQAAKDAALIRQQAIQTVTALGNDAFQIEKNQVQAGLDNLNAAKAKELALVGDNKQAQAIINNKYAEQEKKIKRDQAIADRNQAIFNVGISTAVAVAKANPIIPLMIFAGLTGLAQLAVINSKPIPKFNKGTKSVPGLDTGDDSVLAMVRPTEKIFPVNTSKMYQPALDAIFDNKVPAGLINSFALNYDRIGKIASPLLMVNNNSGIEKKLDSIEKTLSSLPIAQVNVDKRGVKTLIKHASSETEITNNYFRN